jgi:hypothetical protein
MGVECVMDRARGAMSEQSACDQGDSIVAADRTIGVGPVEPPGSIMDVIVHAIMTERSRL